MRDQLFRSGYDGPQTKTYRGGFGDHLNIQAVFIKCVNEGSVSYYGKKWNCVKGFDFNMIVQP